MLSEVILRKFEKNDIKEIKEIYSHYVKNSVVTFEIGEPDEKALAEKYNIMSAKNHPIIVAILNEKIIGFAYASTFRPREAYRFTCENAIYIDPNMRAKGLGSLLLAELMTKAKAFGFNQMIAIITAGTEPSIALHKKHGFKILGKFPELGYKFDRWHDIIHMQKKL